MIRPEQKQLHRFEDLGPGYLFGVPFPNLTDK